MEGSKSTDDIREEIRRRAKAYSEAKTYSLTNSYLSTKEKALVEAWFQIPIGIFNYVMLGLLAFDPGRGFWRSYMIAGIFSACAAIVLRFYSPLPLLLPLGTLLVGWLETVIALGFAAYFAYSKNWLLVVFAVVCGFGVSAIIAPGLWIYTLASRRMHPKYAFAKRKFDITYPFEADLD